MFDAYNSDPTMSLKQNDIKDLITALHNQYDFLYLSEKCFETYKLVKDRTQQFWIEEFSFLGDLPAFRSQKTWIGGVSIRPLFQGIYKYYLKHSETANEGAFGSEDMTLLADQIIKEAKNDQDPESKKIKK
jgi:hypothetical protein